MVGYVNVEVGCNDWIIYFEMWIGIVNNCFGQVDVIDIGEVLDYFVGVGCCQCIFVIDV